jgi:hypothetical protein
MRLIERKEIWLPTAEGWLIGVIFFFALVFLSITQIHGFLAPNSPIKAEVLVVEGWMQDYGIKSAMTEFEKGGYKKLIISGLPLDKGYYLSHYKTTAELSAATLVKLGFDPDKLVTISGEKVARNRTASSAHAIRQWIAQSDLNIKSINLYSHDVHARRSWLIYKQALAPDIQVGIIAVKPIEYDPNRWWMSSSGVRPIISEMIAYLYARFVSWAT